MPVFVLEELQAHRRLVVKHLDILKQMQEDNYIKIRVINDDFDDVRASNSHPPGCGKIDAKVVTDDYNLNKVAASGVAVLNINDLANALKPARIPGEHMNVAIVEAGKEERSRAWPISMTAR